MELFFLYSGLTNTALLVFHRLSSYNKQTHLKKFHLLIYWLSFAVNVHAHVHMYMHVTAIRQPSVLLWVLATIVWRQGFSLAWNPSSMLKRSHPPYTPYFCLLRTEITKMWPHESFINVHFGETHYQINHLPKFNVF